MTIIDVLTKDGPAWVIVGALITIIWKLVKELISVVKSNTAAISKFSEIVSHCSKNNNGG